MLPSGAQKNHLFFTIPSQDCYILNNVTAKKYYFKTYSSLERRETTSSLSGIEGIPPLF